MKPRERKYFDKKKRHNIKTYRINRIYKALEAGHIRFNDSVDAVVKSMQRVNAAASDAIDAMQMAIKKGS